MSDIVYTKNSILSRRAKGMPYEMTANFNAAIVQHLAIMHPKAESTEWTNLFIYTLIVENDYWPREADLEETLVTFLKAVRQGDAPVHSTAVGSYAEAFRQWRTQRNRPNLAQDEPEPVQGYRDSISDSRAIVAQNYSPELADCFDERMTAGGSPCFMQTRRCLRDLLEGIESHLHDHKLAGTVSEFDAYFRDQYRQGRRLWHELKGVEWVILAPKVTNLRMMNRKG